MHEALGGRQRVQLGRAHEKRGTLVQRGSGRHIEHVDGTGNGAAAGLLYQVGQRVSVESGIRSTTLA